MWRAAQSGKTRKIMEMIRDDEHLSAGFHIVICANIRLQVEQLTSRMKRDLYCLPDESGSESDGSTDASSVVSEDPDGDDKIEGGVCTWISASNSSSKRKTVGELANEIKEDNVSMVVCCSHKTRFKHLIALLEDLDKSKHFKKDITIWVDEADASVKLWSLPELDVTRFKKVKRVNLVSATFNSIVQRYGRIPVIGYPDLHPDCYMPLKECTLVVQEMGISAVETLRAVLSAHPEMCHPGVRMFAPALVSRKTHDDVADYLLTKGFAVLVLNGERKCILCPDGTTIPIVLTISGVDPDEIATVLPRLYKLHGLNQWPFAVTGQLCLGRGITFQNNSFEFEAEGVTQKTDVFAFDYGVLPDLPDQASAYQCVARLLGNVKEWPDRKAPTIFMSETMKDWTLAEEHIAIHIGKRVHTHGWADVGVEEIEYVLHSNAEQYERDVTARDSRPADAAPRVVRSRIYTSEADVRAVVKQFHPTYNWRSRSKEGDFYKAAASGPAKVNSLAHVLKVLPNLTGGKGDTATQTMYVPCYVDDTDATTLRYVVPVPEDFADDLLVELDRDHPPCV